METFREFGARGFEWNRMDDFSMVLGLHRLWGGAGLGFNWTVAHAEHDPFVEVSKPTWAAAPTSSLDMIIPKGRLPIQHPSNRIRRLLLR